MTAPEQWLKTCPLCGMDNQCAIAAGRPAESCWCASATIDPEAMAAIPQESIGKRCICPACGQTKGDSHIER